MVLGASKGIPKNLSFQVFGEVRVNLLVCILTKTPYFVCKRPELFRKFLGSLRMILCYWKTFSVPKVPDLRDGHLADPLSTLSSAL